MDLHSGDLVVSPDGRNLYAVGFGAPVQGSGCCAGIPRPAFLGESRDA